MVKRGMKFWTAAILGVVIIPIAGLITTIYEAPLVVLLPVLVIAFAIYIALIAYVDRISRGRK